MFFIELYEKAKKSFGRRSGDEKTNLDMDERDCLIDQRLPMVDDLGHDLTEVVTTDILSDLFGQYVVNESRRMRKLQELITMRLLATNYPTIQQAQIFKDFSHPTWVRVPGCIIHYHEDTGDATCSCYYPQKYESMKIFDSVEVMKRHLKILVWRKRFSVQKAVKLMREKMPQGVVQIVSSYC
jgi:hypothetical protein